MHDSHINSPRFCCDLGDIHGQTAYNQRLWEDVYGRDLNVGKNVSVSNGVLFSSTFEGSQVIKWAAIRTSP